MRSKEILNNIFGFIITDPLHESLRKMRFVSIALIAVSVDIMYRLVAVIEQSKALDSVEGLSAMGVLALGVLTSIYKAVDNITASHGKDS